MNAQNHLDLSLSEALLHIEGNQPLVYHITVAGMLDPEWSERLGGLRIRAAGTSGEAVTVLEGPILDQSQLLGVLNTLSDLRLSLLGVKLIDDGQAASRHPGDKP